MSLFITGIGVLVGFGVLVIYYYQLKAMKASVIATKEAAEAALLNSQALIASQRPQITATANADPRKTLADRQAPRVELSLSNSGPTPAYDFVHESWIEVHKMPFVDFTKLADYYKSPESKVLYPGDPFVVNIPIRSGLTDQQLASLKQGHISVCLRVRVHYRDTFDQTNEWYADFGYVVIPTGLGFLPKYNNAGKKAN